MVFLRPLHIVLRFFFDRHGPHQDLHSFPTRRSSDLIELGGLLFGPAAVEREWSLVKNDDPGLLHQDRKSTRLNSSHRCISYAVFCLKKKKNYMKDQIMNVVQVVQVFDIGQELSVCDG